MEIRRLIEERRSISKGEKQRLKEQTNKKCISDKKEQKDKKRFKEYSKTSQGSRTFQESNLQKEEYSSPRLKKKKGEVITSRKRIANVFGEFDKKYDDEKYDEIELEHEEKSLKTALMSKAAIRER